MAVVRTSRYSLRNVASASCKATTGVIGFAGNSRKP